jgi:hypothetical protein
MEQIGQLITQAMEQSHPVLVLSPSGLTATLQLAVQSKQILHCEFAEIQKPLAYCMMLVGIKGQNIPLNEDAYFLISQIKKNFGGNRLNEIQLAFDLAVNGQLDIEEKEVNAYQDFTFIYFSRVFNSYRRWAAVEYKQIEDKPVQKIYTLEELENIQRADIEAFYQRCLNGVKPPDKLPDYFLPLLIKDGYLGEGSDDLSGFFSYWIGRGYKNIYKLESK